MDRDSIRNLFFTGGGSPADNNNGGSDQLGGYPTPPAAAAAQPSENEATGYPLLLQEYLRQQQHHQQRQHHQQQHPHLQQHTSQQQQLAAAVALENGAGLGGLPGAPRGLGSGFSEFGNAAAAMGGLNNWAAAAAGQSSLAAGGGMPAGDLGIPGGLNNWAASAVGPPSVTGTKGSSASDLSTSDRLILERLQSGSNASFMGAAAAAAAPRDPYAEQGILGPWSERSAGLLGKMVCTDPQTQPTKAKRARRKQPKDKPKRPLSAYNIFFKEERARLLSKRAPEGGEEKRTANGKIGFENLAKIIGGKWQDLKPGEVEYYKEKAGADMQRYKKEMEEYNKKKGSKPSGKDESSSDDDEGSYEEDSAGSAKRQKTA